MSARKSAGTSAGKISHLAMLLLFCSIVLILFLFWQILTEQKKEQKPVRMMASLPSGTITNDLFLEIQKLPGLRRCWVVYSAQTEIKIGSFQTSAEILGVDLSTWPLKITKSAGEKRQGTSPLIVAGEDLFQTLMDEYGTAITKRQAQVFQEKIETLDVEVTFLFSSEDTPFSADAPADALIENTVSEDKAPSSFTGSFLALAEGDKLYMDAVQMKELMKSCRLSTDASCVYLEIVGMRNADRVRKSLEKAGFVVE